MANQGLWKDLFLFKHSLMTFSFSSCQFRQHRPIDSPLSVEELFISIDIWQLITGNINITELDLRSPDLILQRDESGLTLFNLFTRSSPSEHSGQSRQILLTTFPFLPLKFLLLMARVKSIICNTITDFHLPDSLLVTNLDASFFVESLELQQFIEIKSFTANEY